MTSAIDVLNRPAAALLTALLNSFWQGLLLAALVRTMSKIVPCDGVATRTPLGGFRSLLLLVSCSLTWDAADSNRTSPQPPKRSVEQRRFP
jgi:hypothetical protein